MQSRTLRRILGEPALHIVVALGFTVAFLWPIFVSKEPAHTFHFLYAAWFLAIVASFAISRGQPHAPTGDREGADDAPRSRRPAGAPEAR